MGGGFGLVCCADQVLAHTSAQFGTPEVTLGIVPAQIAPFVVRRLARSKRRQPLRHLRPAQRLRKSHRCIIQQRGQWRLGLGQQQTFGSGHGLG